MRSCVLRRSACRRRRHFDGATIKTQNKSARTNATIGRTPLGQRVLCRRLPLRAPKQSGPDRNLVGDRPARSNATVRLGRATVLVAALSRANSASRAAKDSKYRTFSNVAVCWRRRDACSRPVAGELGLNAHRPLLSGAPSAAHLILRRRRHTSPGLTSGARFGDNQFFALLDLVASGIARSLGDGWLLSAP
jgi:hypothetical protein